MRAKQGRLFQMQSTIVHVHLKYIMDADCMLIDAGDPMLFPFESVQACASRATPSATRPPAAPGRALPTAPGASTRPSGRPVYKDFDII